MSGAEDLEALVDGVDSFLQEACLVDRLHKAFDGDEEITRSIWNGMMELGLGGLAVPEEYGGLGLSLLGVSTIGERIGRAGAPGPWISHTLAALAIARAGNAAQKGRWLPRLATGQAVGALAIHERDAWAADEWTLDPIDGILTGAKDYVMGAQDADLAIVGLRGGRLGLVELGGPKVSREPLTVNDRTRPVSRVVFDNAPVEVLPDDFGAGLLDAAAVLLSADAHGGSARMVEDINEYSKVRVQFGHVIAQFQAVKHRLADLALAIYHNGAFYRQVARQLDAKAAEGPLNASILKALVTETSSDVARIATESYGGIGYTWEHSAHIWLRRVMFDYAWLGTPAAHKRRALERIGW
jgi:alkylation response protein AidB-like acyl-CoA dehydrogenase